MFGKLNESNESDQDDSIEQPIIREVRIREFDPIIEEENKEIDLLKSLNEQELHNEILMFNNQDTTLGGGTS